MGASSGFPIDLILFGMVAAFLVLRLRSILGRRTGFERPELRTAPGSEVATGRVIEGHAEPAAAAPPRRLPDPASELGQTLARMRGVDPAHFLQGAEAAFRMIVTAFAEGRRETLRPLLSDEMYHAFEGAIGAREQAGETQRTEIRAIHDATIESAELRGEVAHLGVRFVSDQVSLVVGREGQPVSGTDAVTELTDLWTFERDLSSRDPAWRLIAARSA